MREKTKADLIEILYAGLDADHENRHCTIKIGISIANFYKKKNPSYLMYAIHLCHESKIPIPAFVMKELNQFSLDYMEGIDNVHFNKRSRGIAHSETEKESNHYNIETMITVFGLTLEEAARRAANKSWQSGFTTTASTLEKNHYQWKKGNAETIQRLIERRQRYRDKAILESAKAGHLNIYPDTKDEKIIGSRR